jgi:hypothetical protein
VIEYRPFRNSDPPHLARVWNHASPQPGRLPGLTARILDETTLARLYFEPEGMSVATRDGKVVGFAHGGFGPSSDQSQLDKARGSVSAIVIDDSACEASEVLEISRKLLGSVEVYLRNQGATTVGAGGLDAADPFYLGLLGGSRCEGWPAEDHAAVEWFRAAGYTEQGKRVVWRKTLQGFRAPLDRCNLQWQRAALVERKTEQAASSWWDASTFAQHERNHYQLRLRPPAKRSAQLVFWDVQPFSDASGHRLAGLLSWSCDSQAFSDGLLRFLVCDSLRRMLDYGVADVEAQLGAEDAAMSDVLRSLDFRPQSEKLLLVKPL